MNAGIKVVFRKVNKRIPEQSQPLTPKVQFMKLSHPPSSELAAHCRSNNETDPTQNKVPLHIFLSNDGLVQKPLEALQQGQGIRMQTPKMFQTQKPEMPPAAVVEQARRHSGSAYLQQHV